MKSPIFILFLATAAAALADTVPSGQAVGASVSQPPKGLVSAATVPVAKYGPSPVVSFPRLDEHAQNPFFQKQGQAIEIVKETPKEKSEATDPRTLVRKLPITAMSISGKDSYIILGQNVLGEGDQVAGMVDGVTITLIRITATSLFFNLQSPNSPDQTFEMPVPSNVRP